MKTPDFIYAHYQSFVASGYLELQCSDSPYPRATPYVRIPDGVDRSKAAKALKNLRLDNIQRGGRKQP